MRGISTKHISIIIPPVDFVIVQKEYKFFFKKAEESGLVSYDKILSKFSDEFEDYEYIIPDLKVFRNIGSDKTKKKFNSLKLGKTVSEFGGGISFDSFVNVRP